MQATVSEIHAYPSRPGGYAEPLFHDHSSRKEILEHLVKSGWMEHLVKSGWLFRASEVPRPRAASGSLVEHQGKVLASWREVDRWWEENGGVDLIWRRVETPEGRQDLRAEPGQPAVARQPASAA